MSSYSIPAMSLTNEFLDLNFVAKHVDQLLATTGDQDYAVVYEWGTHGSGPYPPLAVLYRVQGEWVRREVSVTIRRSPNGKAEYSWTVEGGSVNGH
jgi:hypothetical protein